MIAVFRTGHDDTDGQVPLMVHDVSHERTLASAALTDEYTHLVVANLTRVKLFELQIGHFLVLYWVFLYTRNTQQK